MRSHKHEIAVIKQAKKAGDLKTVATLKAKIGSPEIGLGMALYVNAFLWLDTEREHPAAIPWSAIVAYCREYDLNETQRENMLDYIRMIDNAVIEERANQIERQRNSA